eukprot:m51a1_g8732 putative sh2 domain-containing protein (481) ;mRNA; r:11788-13612
MCKPLSVTDLTVIMRQLNTLSGLGELSAAGEVLGAIGALYCQRRFLSGVVAAWGARSPFTEANGREALARVDAALDRLLALASSATLAADSAKIGGISGPGSGPGSGPVPAEITREMLSYDEGRDLIGRGCFGSVYRATLLDAPVAVKVPSCGGRLTDNEVAFFRYEVALYRSFSCPNVVQLYGACTRPGQLLLVTELMDRSLADLLASPEWPRVPLPRRMLMALDAARGLSWLHERCHTAHRDLKPANLLVDREGRVKVSDFGFSEVLARGDSMRDLAVARGTPMYAAPEVLLLRPFDQSADVYSFGLILYEMLTGRTPYDAETPEQLVQVVCDQGVRPDASQVAAPQDLRDLMARCWGGPLERPKLSAIACALRDAVVAASIGDESARGFWKRHFCEPFADRVSWAEFIKAVGEDVGFPPTPERDSPIFGFRSLFAPGASTPIALVSMRRFDTVVSWYGRFFEGPAGQDIFEQARAGG